MNNIKHSIYCLFFFITFIQSDENKQRSIHFDINWNFIPNKIEKRDDSDFPFPILIGFGLTLKNKHYIGLTTTLWAYLESFVDSKDKITAAYYYEHERLDTLENYEFNSLKDIESYYDTTWQALYNNIPPDYDYRYNYNLREYTLLGGGIVYSYYFNIINYINVKPAIEVGFWYEEVYVLDTYLNPNNLEKVEVNEVLEENLHYCRPKINVEIGKTIYVNFEFGTYIGYNHVKSKIAYSPLWNIGINLRL